MKVFRPLQLGYNHRVLEQNRKFYFVISATLGIHLQTGKADLEFNYLQDAFACMGKKPLPDMGMPKPNSEYLVSGSFFSENTEPVTGGEVRVVFGGQEKKLTVFGPRQWKRGGPSAPEPITSMPLDYLHAFGGEKFKMNPDGMGYNDKMLPCIEYPEKLITSTEDKPEPAGYAPLDPSLPQRMQFQGTYDNSYMKNYFPGYPKDFDWHYFLCAPQDQWIDGYFRGNESFEIYNMHPNIPVIKGTLPNMYARCFLQHTIDNDTPQFEELPLNLDTVWFFPEKLLALCIWRGAKEVSDDEAEQISHVLVGYESRLHETRSCQHYKQALDRRLNSDDSLLNYFNTEDLIPVGDKCAMELLQEMALEDSEESAWAENMDAKQKKTQALMDEKLDDVKAQIENAKPDEPQEVSPEAKIDIEKIFREPPVVEPDPDMTALNEKLESIIPGLTSGDPNNISLKNFSFDNIDQVFSVIEETTEKKMQQATEKVEEMKQKVQEQIDQAQDCMEPATEKPNPELQEAFDKMSTIPKEPPTAPLPRINTEKLSNIFSEEIMGSMQHLQGMQSSAPENEVTRKLQDKLNKVISQPIPDFNEGLQQAEAEFKSVYMMGAHFMDTGSSPHKDSEDAIRERFFNIIKKGESVAGGDWACIDLSGQNLEGIDLSGAFLEQVNFTGACLKNANFSKAIMARANLTDADFSGVNLQETNLGAVCAHRTCFAHSNFKKAKLSKGDFTGADFTGCVFEEVESLDIILNNALFPDAQLPGIKFIESSLKEISFENAILENVLFFDCDLKQIDFSHATLTRSIWADVRCDTVIFNYADLSGSNFTSMDPDKSKMSAVQFVKATLNKCNFQGMGLASVDFSKAVIENANFNSADLTKANFTQAQACNSQFRKARLAEAILDGINLMQGSLAKAYLVQASFIGANLYAVDFLRSTMHKTDFHDCNLEATLIEGWKPK